MEDLISLVETYIDKHRLLPAKRLVIGVSGGADSMALLFVLHDIAKRQYPDMDLVCAHLHHGIRKEADEDEALAASFCRKLGIPFETRHVDIPALAEENGISLETAGRKARYAFFDELAGEDGRIAVAHHMEDQAESIAMHIFRGCGMEGLCGIRPLSGKVIHPFLELHKEEILSFCQKEGIPFCNDVTNADITYVRNFWRNEIFPSIGKGTKRNPVTALAGLSERITEENDYLDELAGKELGDKTAISAESLSALPKVLRRRVLKLLAVRTFGDVVDIESCHWDAVLGLCEETEGTAYIDLPGGRKAGREGGKILFLPETESSSEVNGGYIEGAGIVVPEASAGEEIALRDMPVGEIVKFSQSFVRMRLRFIEKGAHVVYNNLTWLFPSSVREDAVIRTRRQGDTICRAGSSCTKELRRFMNEVQIPPRFRDRVLLVSKGQETQWLPTFGHAVGATDAISEEKYIRSLPEDRGEEQFFVLEFFSETACGEEIG